MRAIEGQNNNKQSGIKSIGFNFKNSLSPEALKALDEIVKKEKLTKYSYIYKKPSNKYEFDFREFEHLKPFFEMIYYGKKRIDSIKKDQTRKFRKV